MNLQWQDMALSVACLQATYGDGVSASWIHYRYCIH